MDNALLVSVTHNGVRKTLATCPGIPRSELSRVLKTSFSIEEEIVALVHPDGLIYPLSLLSLDPTLFKSTDEVLTFALLLKDSSGKTFQVAGRAEDEYDYEADLAANEFAHLQHDVGMEEFSEDGSMLGDEEVEQMDDTHVLQFIQHNTLFSDLSLHQIIDVFRTAATGSGVIDKPTFERLFSAVVHMNHPEETAAQKKLVHSIARRVFDVFDRDSSGHVDFAEFTAGLSLLCAAQSGEDKIGAAFDLFDLDGDGLIAFPEMERYLTSFFEVCFALEEDMQQRFGGASPAQVGSATALHCFRRADTDGDGFISFDEFTRWYNSNDAFADMFVPR